MNNEVSRHTPYSVLMSVYHKEKPENLREAMESVWEQTVSPKEFVLICDGPLNEGLDAVIAKMEESHSELLVIRLEKNGGLGNALNVGLKYCSNELIARMDSDDISRPDRCEKQLRAFEENSDISIISGTVEEFSVSKDVIEARRTLPESPDEIEEFAKKRNPFNHPCVMYKKKAVEAAGGYQDFYLLEDYYLWIRMIQNGSRGYNFKEPLLWMRAGADLYKRRSGWKYAMSQRKLFQYMRKQRFIGPWRYFLSVTSRIVVSIMPGKLRELLFKKAVRTA